MRSEYISMMAVKLGTLVFGHGVRPALSGIRAPAAGATASPPPGENEHPRYRSDRVILRLPGAPTDLEGFSFGTLNEDHGNGNQPETLDQQIVTRYPASPPGCRRSCAGGSSRPGAARYCSMPSPIWDPSLPLAGPGCPRRNRAGRGTARRPETGSGRSICSRAAESAGCGKAPGSRQRRSPFGRPGEPALAVLRYTNRQRRAFENLRFVLEEGLAERVVESPDADREYAEAVAHPVRDAQALVGGRPRAVIWRLLGYLRPYRRELSLGMGAATLITLVSLVPPWLAGYVLDRLVAPARKRRACRSSGRRPWPGSPSRPWRRCFWCARVPR